MLLTMMATTGTMWGQETVTATSSNLSANVSYQDLESGKLIEYKNSASNSYSNPIRIYANNTFTIHAKEGVARITEVAIVANSTSYASTTNNATWTATGTGTCSASSSVSGSNVTVTISGEATTITCKPSAQVRWDQLSVTYITSGSSSLTSTTVTIDASGLTNTDVYVNTEAGSLSATVKDDENNSIDGATVTWTSSATGIATIDADGEVTLVSAGKTTITASYAGNSTYSPSFSTYELTVTSSEPYNQPKNIEIIPNYTFWGKTGQFSGGTFSELSGSKDNVSLYWTKGEGSTYANLTAMRFYKDNTLVFTAPTGYEIKSIVITFTTAKDDLSFSPEGYSLSGTTGTWAGSSATVTMSRPSNADSYAQISKFTVTIGSTSNLLTVTYDANGATSGSVPTDSNEYESGAEVTVLENTGILAKAGYVWAGWNTKADGTGTDRAEGSKFNISENTTLYAKWEAKTITNLAYTGTPTATQYAGQAFNPAGLTVTATFNDESQEDVTSQVVWTPNPLTIETISVTGTYMGLSVVVENITVTYAPGTQDNPYTVAQARAAIDAGTGVTNVYATGIVSEIVTEYSTQWSNITFDIVDESGDAVSLRAYRCVGDDAANVQVNDIAVIYGNLTQYGEIYEFASGCQLVSLEHPIVTEPTITVTPATVNVSAEGEEGTLTVTYENITTINAEVYFCDANGDEATYNWIAADINNDNNVYYFIDANDGEARTAYLKVYALDDNAENVYSNLVTINQDEYVAPTYAALPFSFDGGIGNIANTDGLYQEGLGSDYSSSPKLKFDGTGDWLLLQFQERPGTLTFNIKNNSFSGGTFTVQTSEDGVTYTDLQAYTEITGTQNEEFTNLGENVRYIKWIYTEKSSGNVGLGNIALTKYVAPVPAITVESTSITATAEETQGTLNVTYTAIETDLGASIYWYTDNTGTTTTDEPNWISAEINQTTLNVYYLIEANTGAARTAYFKVCSADAQTNLVYSELVTVNQAAASQNYNLTVEPFENLELITFVDDQMELEGDGNIQVTSGAQVMLSVVANEGFVIETLMVNGVDHADDINANNTYSFAMPGENVTISATAVEFVPPVGGNYVRINDIIYLTDGAKVIIAARYDEDNTNKYYAMTNATSGKPTGVLFTSSTENTFEILPSDITDEEDNYYWTVGITENGYTFTNANDEMIGYNSSTNFATGGNNTEWDIEFGTSDEAAMVANYEAFTITNHNQNSRGFALNSSHNFGPYATSNYTSNSYNFYLDFFVQGAEPVVTPSITLSSYIITDVPATSATPGADITETLTVTIANIENFDDTNLGADYCNADGSAITVQKPNFIGFEFAENPSATDSYILTCTFEENTDSEARTAYFKVTYNEDEVVSQVVTATQLGYVAPEPTITVYPTSVSATAAETEDYLAITLDNIVITEEGNGEFDLIFCDSEGEPLPDQSSKPDWFAFEFSFNDVWSMPYTISENTETTARTLYCKVKGTGDDGTTVAYSELVTVTQAGFVIDYATLPFEWEGGPRSEFEALTGTSTYSVGDYTSETVYCMKLDATDDYIQIKTNEQPGIVTIGVKMVGGASTSHIIVKGSSDGDNFTDVEDLTISGAQNSTHTLETTNDFATTDRYVRLYFNKGSNVGVGPITIAQVDLTPSITVAPATLNLNCDGGDGELTVTHKNLADDPQLAVIFVESDGETQTTCDWIEASINANGNVAGHIDTNTGEARTAYLKVTGRDAENNLIKSNLVTFNQAAYTEPSIVFETTTLDIVADGENRTMSFDYEGLGQNPTFSINFYESDGTTAATYPWLTALITPEEKVDITVSANEGAARSAYFKVSGVNGEVNALSNLVTINQAAYTQLATYSLVTSVDDIVSGKHYIIASSATDGAAYAMGGQTTNNRSGVAVTIENGQIAETEGVYEFVINTHETSSKDVDYYTIYDAVTPGYLYAASSSKNYLRTETTLDNNGKWTISIATEGSVASVVAQGSNTNKTMKFNSSNYIFSCYASGQSAIYLYVKDNDNDYEYYGTEVAYPGTSIPESGSITVGDGTVMTLPNNFENTDPTALIIEDGGQLIHTADVEATVQKSVSGYTNKSGNGWYLIASPVDNYSTSTIATGTYDLFIYNEPNAYWYSSTGAAAPFNTLERGKGYLYANAANVNLNYAGTMKATNANITVDLSFECDAYPDLRGFNLMGNPFSRNLGEGDMTVGSTAVTMYYGFDDAREEFETKTIASTPIKPGQGFFIQATEAGQQLVFNPATSKDASDFKYISISAGDENFTDKAYIQFGYGNTLRKMTFGENTMVYVMNDDLDYAAARVEELAGTMPVHFVPIEDGFYTITVETKNIENLNYMHLIDNIKNTEIDLLVEPSYTFKASESDNADRFHLVFDFNNYTDVNENYTNGNFAYQIGDEIFVSGEGTLQVFDMLGRFVAGYNVNGDKRISTDAFNTGVYIFRMVGTEVKTQKIIVR